MPGLVTIGSSRRLELTDGEQVLFVESSSSAMLEAEGSRPASHLAQVRAAERAHLALMEDLLAPKHRSRLQWPWRWAGWLIGALPAAINKQWVFATIATVETFVDEHYTQQLDRLNRTGANQIPAQIGEVLAGCRADEVQHQQDAAGRLSGPLSATLKAWLKLVELGSRGAVVVARAI